MQFQLFVLSFCYYEHWKVNKKSNKLKETSNRITSELSRNEIDTWWKQEDSRKMSLLHKEKLQLDTTS